MNVVTFIKKQTEDASRHKDLALMTYMNDIGMRLLETHTQNCCTSNPLRQQSDLTKELRMYLFNWLLELKFKFELKTRTFFLTGNIFNRSLRLRPVLLHSLQGLLASSLYVASKYEDIY